ncbi:hypothetical protein [Shewanella frigidimarina]|uniref:hypothetical protein n=1 Tax=Shewanella frigidimarina TaxID=56812 RepID=UPI003D7B1F49
MFDSMVIVIGMVGGFASIVSLLIDKANLGGKYIHAVYVFAVTILASTLVISVASNKSENAVLVAEIKAISSIEYGAAKILNNAKRSTDGEQRGFILASLALLERHKSEVPDSYEAAKQFSIASGILQNLQESGTDRLYQGWRLRDASEAMESLLLGLSANSGNEN